MRYSLAFLQGACPSVLRTFRPMALGSPTGCSVPRDLRLLWPYPSLCLPPNGLMLISAWPCACRASLQRVPNLLCQSIWCVPSSVLRWSWQVLITMPCLPVLSSPNSNGFDDHVCPRQSRTTEDVLSKLQCSLNATARHFACPALVRTFTSELSRVESPRSSRRI
jgi:hypothetical protein